MGATAAIEMKHILPVCIFGKLASSNLHVSRLLHDNSDMIAY